MVAPNSIPLLFLISVYLDNDWEDADQEEELLDFLASCLQSKVGLLPDTLHGFIDMIESYRLKLTNVDISTFLLEQIPRLCESRYALESFLKEVGELLESSLDVDSVQKTVASTSVLGLFIKSCILDFESMKFEEAGIFFRDVCTYCTSGIPKLDMVLTERYIDYQVLLLQQTSGVSVPAQISDALDKIEKQIPTMYKRHYLGYLNALRCGNMQEALSCLRKYFDYAIKDSQTAPVQYSALNLAAIYSRLQFPDKALTSIQIGMLYARDENDQNCLSYLLCWLHQLAYNINLPLVQILEQPSERLVLESLSARTTGQSQYELAAICELRRANWATNARMDDQDILEYIDAATELCLKHNLTLASKISLARAHLHRWTGESDKYVHYLEEVVQNTTDSTPEIDVATAMSQLAEHYAGLGDIDEALGLINEAKERFPTSQTEDASLQWKIALGFIVIDAALRKSELENAEYFLGVWEALFASDQLVTTALKIKRAVWLDKIGQTPKAIALLQPLA
ncbi:anaphase promoting complex subunit 5, partial [Kappamyces sp. JEL0680]